MTKVNKDEMIWFLETPNSYVCVVRKELLDFFERLKGMYGLDVCYILFDERLSSIWGRETFGAVWVQDFTLDLPRSAPDEYRFSCVEKKENYMKLSKATADGIRLVYEEMHPIVNSFAIGQAKGYNVL